MILRVALRNLRRHRWRSVLTAGGIALAVAMLVWTKAWMDTFARDMVRAATAVEIGQVQLRTDAYVDRPSIYASFALDDELMDAVRTAPGVDSAAPRTYAYGLVGNERRSQVARLIGVDPSAEAATALLDDGVREGRWLADMPAELPNPRECVVGYQLANQLGVGVGDQLVLFLQAADGSLGNDLLEIVGILRTANSSVDRNAVVVHRDDLAYTAALEGRAHEVVVAVSDLNAVDVTAAAIATGVPPTEDGPRVRTWKETMSDLAAMLDTYDSSMWLTYLLVYAVAALGLLNTQRMSALERRREFGVLQAIGMRPRRVGWMIVAETVILTGYGAAAGMLIGGGLSLFHKTHGLDMGALTSRSGDFAFMGVAFSERMYFEVSVASVVEPALVILGVALLCGAVPAWSAMRIDAIRAISGRV